MTPKQLKNNLLQAPESPGIYIFRDSKNKSLYIGKALNIKNRLKNYLKTEDPRLQRMILESRKIEFKTTDSEIEALLLESQYIKKYNPPFNIMLRDDKQYFFVGFSRDKFPRIFLTHQPDGTNFIGPFTDGNAIKTTLRLLRKVFPYCTCKQSHNNYCLNYHIGKCPGDCCLKKPATNTQLMAYRKNIKAITNILSGKKSSLIKSLEKEMRELSKKQDYEKAGELQSRIEKVKRVFENALIIRRQTADSTAILEELKDILKLSRPPRRIEAYDIANIQGRHATGAMVVFSDGIPDKSGYRKFKISSWQTPNDTAMLQEILIRRFNHPEWPSPDLILIDGGKAQLATAKKAVKNIPVIAMTKNEYHAGYKIILNNKSEVLLSKLPNEIKNLLLNIDSEAHRFAISFYRKLHRRSIG